MTIISSYTRNKQTENSITFITEIHMQKLEKALTPSLRGTDDISQAKQK